MWNYPPIQRETKHSSRTVTISPRTFLYLHLEMLNARCCGYAKIRVVLAWKFVFLSFRLSGGGFQNQISMFSNRIWIQIRKIVYEIIHDRSRLFRARSLNPSMFNFVTGNRNWDHLQSQEFERSRTFRSREFRQFISSSSFQFFRLALSSNSWLELPIIFAIASSWVYFLMTHCHGRW